VVAATRPPSADSTASLSAAIDTPAFAARSRSIWTSTYPLPRIGSAITSDAPGTRFSAAATDSEARTTSSRLRPSTRTPTAVFTPVASMSTRFWIGMVQTLAQPGICTALSSSLPKPTSSDRSLRQSNSPAAKGFASSAGRESSAGIGSMSRGSEDAPPPWDGPATPVEGRTGRSRHRLIARTPATTAGSTTSALSTSSSRTIRVYVSAARDTRSRSSCRTKAPHAACWGPKPGSSGSAVVLTSERSNSRLR